MSKVIVICNKKNNIVINYTVDFFPDQLGIRNWKYRPNRDKNMTWSTRIQMKMRGMAISREIIVSRLRVKLYSSPGDEMVKISEWDYSALGISVLMYQREIAWVLFTMIYSPPPLSVAHTRGLTPPDLTNSHYATSTADDAVWRSAVSQSASVWRRTCAVWPCREGLEGGVTSSRRSLCRSCARGHTQFTPPIIWWPNAGAMLGLHQQWWPIIKLQPRSLRLTSGQCIRPMWSARAPHSHHYAQCSHTDH